MNARGMKAPGVKAPGMRTLPLLLALTACAVPPPEAYTGGSAGLGARFAIGANASGEACTQQGGAGRSADVFCGTWTQPSAHIAAIGPAQPGDLPSLAASSPWRTGLDARLLCEAPRPTTVLNGPALILNCVRKAGGWPQVALVTVVNGTAYGADGIQPALPVIPRAIGVLSGTVSAEAAPALPQQGADALLASRLAAQAFKAGDVGQFEQLIQAGTRANLAEAFAPAEQAFRAALQIQQKALGKQNPDTALPLMLTGLQVSNQGRFAEADGLFASAGTLAPRAADEATPARLLHYRALHALNQKQPDRALALLREAETGYAAVLPPEALATRGPAVTTLALGRSGASAVNNPVPADSTVIAPAQQNALMGMIEAKRYEAIALRDLGRPAESEAALRQATAWVRAQGLRQPILSARLLRTGAAGAAVEDASDGLGLASVQFDQAVPGTRPVAATLLLHAARLQSQGRDGAALAACRRAVVLLRELKAGTAQDLLHPCLGLYAAAPGDPQANLAEMFEAAQLAQGGITSQQIAQSAARLQETARDPKVGAAIRARQDSGERLALLQSERDEAGSRGVGVAPTPDRPRLLGTADLDTQLTEARQANAEADAALQAASPNFGQLVQDVVPASQVFAALRPGEAFALITTSRSTGWVFALRDGRIAAALLGAPPAQVAALVQRFRAGVVNSGSGPAPFDTAAAQSLYDATLRPVQASLEGAESVVIAPSGPLLSVPFGALLTGRADGLREAPWLVRRMAVSHVPAAANFVALRRIAGLSRAGRPWLGLGDFRPVTVAQARATLGPGCAEDARLFAGLPRLPLAGPELNVARQVMGGTTRDELLGAAYTVPAVQRAALKDYRVLHFASHALLPAELRCIGEPAIVTSAPTGAPDARGALLTSSAVLGLDLDADTVILSACNSAGPQGPAGESLSGLARAFFFAGARSMLATHWSINDQASAFLVANTLERLKGSPGLGMAGALRAAQLGMLDGAGRGTPAELAHPYYWAPFALIGEGSGALGRLAGL